MSIVLALGAFMSPQFASAAPLLSGLGGPAGFGVGVLADTDDGASPPFSISTAFPDGMLYGAAPYTELVVNANGTVSFGSVLPPLGSGFPAPFPVSPIPAVSPYMADVDTRGSMPGGPNVIYWAVERGRVVVTYDRVGYYSLRVDRLNSFQVIFSAPSRPGAGARDFDVELRYDRCEWTTGDASDGAGGLGGRRAQVGFDAGDFTRAHMLPGSGTAAVLDLCTTSNVGAPGVWRFEVRGGWLRFACGNGILEEGEECDDGNDDPTDECSSTCRVQATLGDACTTGIECGSGYCVDGVCCDSQCDSQCEACDVISGTCTAVIGAPHGSRPACAGDVQCGGACDGSSRESCAYDDSSVACEDGLTCTTDDRCDGAGACVGGARNPCDDGDPCTSDSCDDLADACDHDDGGGCAIGGACVAPGALDPTNGCRACQPLVSRTRYALREVGASCDDGLYCTVGDSCGASGDCLAGEALVCDDGVECTTDECDEATDTCVSTASAVCAGDDAGHTGPLTSDAGRHDSAPATAACSCRIERQGERRGSVWAILALLAMAVLSRSTRRYDRG